MAVKSGGGVNQTIRILWLIVMVGQYVWCFMCKEWRKKREIEQVRKNAFDMEMQKIMAEQAAPQEEKRYHQEICPKCGGGGMGTDGQPCTSCGGAGVCRTNICSGCEGSGVTAAPIPASAPTPVPPAPAAEPTPASASSVCPVCGGKGVNAAGYTCPVCSGSGVAK